MTFTIGTVVRASIHVRKDDQPLVDSMTNKGGDKIVHGYKYEVVGINGKERLVLDADITKVGWDPSLFQDYNEKAKR